jgi:hypothetical protein
VQTTAVSPFLPGAKKPPPDPGIPILLYVSPHCYFAFKFSVNILSKSCQKYCPGKKKEKKKKKKKKKKISDS